MAYPIPNRLEKLVKVKKGAMYMYNLYSMLVSSYVWLIQALGGGECGGGSHDYDFPEGY